MPNLRRIKAAVSFSVLVCAVFSSFASDKQNDEVAADIDPALKTLTIIEYSHQYNLNPHTAAYSSEAQVLCGLYEGLFSYEPATLEPKHAIAKEHRISRDKKRWTFILREDAQFSDGSAITAECIRESWLRLLEHPRAPYASLFDIVSGARLFRQGEGRKADVGISAADAKTLIVQLEAPASYLPKILCMSAFSAVSPCKSVYSGAYCLEKQDEAELILKKNERYYDADAVKLDRIVFALNDDGIENVFSFNTGAAQWISGSAELKNLLSSDALRINAQFATEYLFFKQRGGIWDNAELRSALLEAVPWDKLRADTFVAAKTLVYPLTGYPTVQGYVYADAAAAAALMEDARKKAGICSHEKLPLVFAVSGERMKKEAELLQEAWRPLGVEVQVKEYAASEYLAAAAGTGADMFSYTWIGDFADPLAFLELFRGDSNMNISGWRSNEFDRLLAAAELYADERHLKLLSEAEQILLDAAVVLPIQHPVSRNIIDLNAVGGWYVNSFDIHPLKYLFRKETKPKLPNVVRK